MCQCSQISDAGIFSSCSGELKRKRRCWKHEEIVLAGDTVYDGSPGDSTSVYDATRWVLLEKGPGQYNVVCSTVMQ